MTLITLAAIALVLNVAMIAWTAVRSWRRRKVLFAQIEELKNVGVDALAEARRERARAEGALATAQKEHERADGYFRYFQQIEKERNEWQRLYHEAGVGMSRGQSVLMMEIVRLSNLLKRHQIDPREDPKVALQVAEYVAKHGEGAPPHEEAVRTAAHDPLAIGPATPPGAPPASL